MHKERLDVSQSREPGVLGQVAEERASLAAALGMPFREALGFWTPELPLGRFLKAFVELAPWNDAVGAVLRALEEFPEDPAWVNWDGEPSLEMVLLVGHPEDSVAVRAAERALQRRRGCSEAIVVHRRDSIRVDLNLASPKPERLEGLSELVLHGPDLLDWRPKSLVGFAEIHLPGVQGVWELGSAAKGAPSAMHRRMPTEFDLTEGLALRLDGIRAGCLRVLRPLRGGGRISYAIPPDCSEVGPGFFKPEDPVDTRFLVELRGMKDPVDWVPSLHRVSELSLCDLHLEAWPEGFEVIRALELVGVAGLKGLPEGVRFLEAGTEERQGWWVTLQIEDCPTFEFLPPGLSCPKGLVLANLPKLRELPRGIMAGRMCVLRNLCIETIPDDIEIENKESSILILEDLPNIKAIPASYLKYNTDVFIKGCGLEALPEGFTVESLTMKDLPFLRALPAGGRVRGHLDISGCENLTFISDDLIVGGDIRVDDELLRLVPKHLASQIDK